MNYSHQSSSNRHSSRRSNRNNSSSRPRPTHSSSGAPYVPDFNLPPTIADKPNQVSYSAKSSYGYGGMPDFELPPNAFDHHGSYPSNRSRRGRR